MRTLWNENIMYCVVCMSVFCVTKGWRPWYPGQASAPLHPGIWRFPWPNRHRPAHPQWGNGRLVQSRSVTWQHAFCVLFLCVLPGGVLWSTGMDLVWRLYDHLHKPVVLYKAVLHCRWFLWNQFCHIHTFPTNDAILGLIKVTGLAFQIKRVVN